MSKNNVIQRCSWVSQDKLDIDYHDKEWGVPVYDEQCLFEFLVLEGMQAGLSWLTVLKKRENYRTCFDNFKPEKIVAYNKTKVNSLLKNPGLIRHRLKIESIISNANAFLKIKKEEGSFADYLWRFVDGKPLQNHLSSHKERLVTTAISDRLSKDLKKRGFKFIGSTICYAFMQAVGMVNDHTTNCFRYRQLLSKT